MLEREAESAAGGAEPSPGGKEPVTKGEGEGVSTWGGGRSPGKEPVESHTVGTLG